MKKPVTSIESCRTLFFFNDTATTEIYTLSLHDALPILGQQHHRGDRRVREQEPHLVPVRRAEPAEEPRVDVAQGLRLPLDRKSTRLNSSHANISYAVFCLKKIKHVHIVHLQRSYALMNS